MSAEAARPFALAALVPETANGEHTQTMGAGPPRLLAALAEHGDGQNTHTVRGGAAGAVAAAAGDAGAVMAEVLCKATYTRAEGTQAVRRRAAGPGGAVRVLAGDGDGRSAGGRGHQRVAPLGVDRLIQRALLVLWREQATAVFSSLA